MSPFRLILIIAAVTLLKAFFERIGRQAAEECLKFAPWLAKTIIRFGARLLLPSSHQQRYIREWSAHLDDFQRLRNSPLAMVGCALGIITGAPRIAWQKASLALTSATDLALRSGLAARLAVVVGVMLGIALSVVLAGGPTVGLGVGLGVVLGSVVVGLLASMPAVALANRLRRKVQPSCACPFPLCRHESFSMEERSAAGARHWTRRSAGGKADGYPAEDVRG